MSERFKLSSVTGYSISGGHKPITVFSALDTAFKHMNLASGFNQQKIEELVGFLNTIERKTTHGQK